MIYLDSKLRMSEGMKIQRKMDHGESHGPDSEAPNSVGVWSLKMVNSCIRLNNE